MHRLMFRKMAMNALTLELLELARVLVRFDHIADFIVNANHSMT
jgi:hypothetical protein